MSIELKIKSKHLALEPSIIKAEERKLIKQIAWAKSNGKEYKEYIALQWKLDSLISHRRLPLRDEARATYIARAYLSGKPYASVEKTVNDKQYFDRQIRPRVLAMVKKYGKWDTTESDIRTWTNPERDDTLLSLRAGELILTS